MSQKQKNKVLSWVDNNCLLKLKDLRIKVKEKFNILTSKSAIDRIFHEFHYTMKSTVLVPERRNDTRTIDIREQYAEKFRRLETETKHSNLIFLDEVGFSVISQPKKGHLIAGSYPYVSVSAARSHISVVAAMNKYGMIYHKIHNNAVNGKMFKTFLIEFKNACHAKGINTPVFILDTTRIHHYRGLAETIDELILNLCFLLSYSPFLNPIENIFSAWKNLVIRVCAKSENELKEIILSKFTEITREHCDSFYLIHSNG